MSAGPAMRAADAAAPADPAFDLDRLFRPRAIAVVGATETPGAVGSQVIENLIHHGFGGTVLPINPKYAAVHGFTCFPDIAALPEVPDLVAIAVPAAHVAGVVAAAGRKGIPFAVVFASGFAETGEAGIALQAELARVARAAGVRLIGPNCQGIMNIADRIHVGFGPPYRLTYKPGSVGVVSQSGAFGNSLVMGMSDEGIGMRRYASTGNEVDTNALDLIDGMLDDPEIGVIAGYIEGFRDAVPLRRIAAKAVARNVPVVLWKVGNSKAGAHAAASHTANLAGDPRFYRAAFDQLGIVSADDVGDMADCIRALAPRRWASGPRVGIVTISGGAGVAMADRAEELGLSIEPFADATLADLRTRLPAFASVANPLDVTAGALTDPDSVREALEAVVGDPGVDMLAVALAATAGDAAITMTRALAALSERVATPIVVAWNASRTDNRAAYDILEAARIPVFATPGRAIRGLSAIRRFGAAVNGAELPVVAETPAPAGAVRTLNEMDSKGELAGTGIVAPREAVADSAEAAVAAAQAIGFPAVMKLLSETIVHKSDIGGVRLNLASDAEVREAFAAIADAGRKAEPGVAPQVLVQQQVPGGVEVILGARVDEVFGPMVMVGAGGILAEVISDVAFRLAPIGIDEARRMIAETRVARILAGIRGRPRCDVDALAEAIAGLSHRIASADGGLRDIEINPLFVQVDGEGVIAGDCVAHVAATDPAASGSRT